jgi:membrane protein implicated in regulation of membrane protease activity
MILPTYSGLTKLALASGLGVSAGLIAGVEAVVGDAWPWKVISALLAIVGALLLAAWNDLRRRDQDTRETHRELFQRMNALDKDVARLQERTRGVEPQP